MIDVRTNGLSLAQLLTAPPVLKDSVDGVCTTLELNLVCVDGFDVAKGQVIELWYRGVRWFIGVVFRRSVASNRSLKITAYDPLYYLKRTTDDWYFDNMTGTQSFRQLAEKAGVRIAYLANTGAVLPLLYYKKAEADKVAVDLIARTHAANGRRYWYRYQPDDGNDGLILFERQVPSEVWVFQVGVNIESASLDESIEETATIVKLVNRETGKKVTVADSASLKQYGPLVHFEEVDKDQAKTMDARAAQLLKTLKAVGVTMQVTGINPDGIIPRLYSGDVIYVEEPVTRIIGGYYITNVTHTLVSADLVRLDFDLKAAPDVPAIQYDDADDEAKKKAKQSTSGVSNTYSAEVKGVMDKYGI